MKLQALQGLGRAAEGSPAGASGGANQLGRQGVDRRCLPRQDSHGDLTQRWRCGWAARTAGSAVTGQADQGGGAIRRSAAQRPIRRPDRVATRTYRKAVAERRAPAQGLF